MATEGQQEPKILLWYVHFLCHFLEDRYMNHLLENLHFKNLSHCTRIQTSCMCKNKGADQLRSNCEGDQRLCFATRIVQFLSFLNLKFSASWHRLCLYSLVCVRSDRNPKLLVFSCEGSNTSKDMLILYLYVTVVLHPNSCRWFKNLKDYLGL